MPRGVDLRLRRGTASAWTSANPTLNSGELAVETDTGLLKLGDGATAWTSLAYLTDFVSPVLRQFCGNGSDGAVLFDGTTTPVAGATLSGSIYTLQRDVVATTVRVPAGVAVRANGYRVLARTSVTIDSGGQLVANGFDASATNAGATPGAGTVGTGSAGAATSTGAGTASTATSNSMGGRGGNGGAGGTGAAGTSGTVTAPAAATGGVQVVTQLPWAVMARGVTAGTFSGGSGGASGGGDGTNAGGPGGGGGGVLVVAAPQVVNNGNLYAKGGAGGTPTTGNTGGGGGGGGGLVLVTCTSYTGTDAVVTGGNAGAKAGTGSNGTAGAAGTFVKNVLS